MKPLIETNLPNLYYRGKVRDTYDFGNELLIVATDRISAFDSVLPCGIPDKGLVLNLLSAFWFQKTAFLMSNHFVELVEDARLLDIRLGSEAGYSYPSSIARRSMIVKKAKRIDVECVVRGYLAGSAWAEYAQSGTIFGVAMPRGLGQSQKLPEPIFTPTTKAASGHDQPLTPAELNELVGESIATELSQKSMIIYQYAHEYALKRDIIIADTKMEFGLIDGEVTLIDELLTPDSSRFWDTNNYVVGRSQPSFDKQPVRDWLVASGWNKEPPAPMLPPDIIEQTTRKYREAYRRLTGKTL